MLKMNKLQRSAMESCDFRGHNMGTWRNLTHHSVVSKCIDCGKEVVCNTQPDPNDIAIGGEAVALHCLSDRDRENKSKSYLYCSWRRDGRTIIS